jgi:hypothetical protein
MFVVGASIWWAESSQPVIQPRPQPSYPSQIRFVPPNQCVGVYDNNVGVSWPAVNGTC